MTLTDLPLLNASLNATSAALLLLGYAFIRNGHVRLHRAAMVGAFTVSTLFLISYLVYHANVGSKPFPGRGAIRPVYFAILISHIVLAATVPPLALVTLIRALRGRFDRHVAVARWTLPVWLYVSVTGVIIYVMLYVVY